MKRARLHWVVLLTACSTGGGGSFTSRGYESELYPYSVRYAQGTTRSFVSRDWVIDNFRREGSVVGAAKTTREYVTRIEADIDDDGRLETLARTHRYDLRLRHRGHNAVMWIRNIPMSPNEAENSLEALAETYIQRSLDPDVFGHSGTVDVTPSPPEWGRPTVSVTLVVERPRGVVSVTDRLNMTIDGREAHGFIAGITTGEVAHVSPDRRIMNAAVVLIRTDYPYVIRGTRGSRELPTIMVVGYANRPERFAEGLEDFRQLLASLEL